MSDGGEGPTPGPFRYHLELTPAQLKLTHVALCSLLAEADGGGAVARALREVLAKLPDDRAIGAIRLEEELERDFGEAGDGESSEDESPSDDEPPDSVA